MEAPAMADLYPDEGLDALLAVVPKQGTTPTQMFLGLYTAQGGTSIPSNQATLAGAGANMQGCAEVSTTQWSTYLRITVPSGSWGAQSSSTVWSTSGRIVTSATPCVFPAPSAPYNPTPNSIAGFFLSNASFANSGLAYYYSNFSDSSLIASMAIGDVIKVTPTFGLGNS
jgi:hypothetical protein